MQTLSIDMAHIVLKNINVCTLKHNVKGKHVENDQTKKVILDGEKRFKFF